MLLEYFTCHFSGLNCRKRIQCCNCIDSTTENRSLSHVKMTPTTNLRVLAVSLLSLLTAPLTTVVETSPSPSPQHIDRSGRPFTEQPKTGPSPSLLLLAMQANIRPAAPQDRTKNPEKLPESSEGVLETPPRPLPQVMFPKNVTSAEALAPPLGAAQVAPIRPRLMDVWMDGCRGYYDVMGHFDSAFNCSKDTFVFCCGTCHYRFCCPERSRQLEQDSCKNYDSPDWAKPHTDSMIISEELGPDPDFDPLKQQSHNTGFVIGGVVVFMVAVAVGIKVVFNKVQQEANQRDLNMPRWDFEKYFSLSSPLTGVFVISMYECSMYEIRFSGLHKWPRFIILGSEYCC